MPVRRIQHQHVHSGPDQPPVIDQNYNGTDADRIALRAGVRIARRIFAQAAFDPMRGEELGPGSAVQDDAAIDAYIRAKAEAAIRHGLEKGKNHIAFPTGFSLALRLLASLPSGIQRLLLRRMVRS